MSEELLFKMSEQLQQLKGTLEKEDGHSIKSISVSKEYNKDGFLVPGLSIIYSDDVKSNKFILIDLVERTVNRNVQWFRFSPKGFFFSFE
jgi:hypothetical protein